MYELGENVSAISSFLFSIIGIWMAHSLYRSPRKRQGIILAWGLCYLFLIVVTPPLSALLPGIPYVRLSMLLGFSGIFVYLYLFTNIPFSQRVFTYFMVDTAQTLLVLLARTLSALCVQWFHVPGDAVFLCIYLPLLAAFVTLFHVWLKHLILRSLRAFGNQLRSLAAFAAVAYVTLLLQIDTWGPWPTLDFWSAGGRLGMIGFVLMGYVLAFRTLAMILAQDASDAQSRQAASQLTLSEQYYESLVGQIEEVRVRDHDLRHHIAALSGLCAQGELEKAQEYLKSILGALPERLPEHYCKVGALNALLGHFASQCREGGIRFRYEISLPEPFEVGPLSLCVIFGNALQNAVEACLAVEDPAQRFLSLKAAPAQGRLAIELSNGCAQAPCGDGTGGYQSTKAEPGHGLGLGSIRATVERYHGWCDTSYENGVFTLRVLL